MQDTHKPRLLEIALHAMKHSLGVVEFSSVPRNTTTCTFIGPQWIFWADTFGTTASHRCHACMHVTTLRIAAPDFICIIIPRRRQSTTCACCALGTCTCTLRTQLPRLRRCWRSGCSAGPYAGRSHSRPSGCRWHSWGKSLCAVTVETAGPELLGRSSCTTLQ